MDYEKLLIEIKHQLSKAPRDTILMNKLAILYMENNKYEEAIEMLERAVTINPNIETLTNLGWFYLHEGKLSKDRYYEDADEEAVELLERAVKCNPKSHFTYSALGEAYLKTNRLKEAEEVLRKSLAIKANGCNQNNLGAALFKQNLMLDALYWFEIAYKAAEESDDNFRQGINLGVTTALLGKRTEAEEVAELLLHSKQRNESYYDLTDIAQIYYITENYEEVLRIYSSYEYTLGIGLLEFYVYALVRCGQEKLAFKLVKEAIDNNLEQIAEADEELKEHEVRELIQHIEAENVKLVKLLEDLKHNKRPDMYFQPYLVDECYLYGCYQHKNPDYD